ncbi:hypothetical protein CXB51_036970 [Gossypium anomalum]|uniref:NB-ARC domain-containing protein n=1 Tax=Gossypium anomalum TaxID=47600 RepID=A0A8J5Y0A3_9ROSI|nr:hypothetical protein CXB51_036970 [Gossypium anomalum]
MNSICLYELKGVPHEDCLTLFIKWAFNDGDERHYPNLIRIGEEIVKKCKGVPLAVRTLGSLLFQKTDESDWIFIRESEIWRLEQDENDILPVLKLSYNHLPSHLQRCLAFLSLYQKDEIYLNDKIIRLWMANGLLEHPKQNQEWEDYLRALELSYSPLNGLPNSICTLKQLRDLDLHRCRGIRELLRSFYKFHSLQSLNLVGSGLEQLPNSVLRLIELRHLVITVDANHLKEIRAGYWTSLQYLKLHYCLELECLPEGMQYLKSLRTLVVSNCIRLVS